jgi:hypothetical protein
MLPASGGVAYGLYPPLILKAKEKRIGRRPAPPQSIRLQKRRDCTRPQAKCDLSGQSRDN